MVGERDGWELGGGGCSCSGFFHRRQERDGRHLRVVADGCSESSSPPPPFSEVGCQGLGLAGET